MRQPIAKLVIAGLAACYGFSAMTAPPALAQGLDNVGAGDAVAAQIRSGASPSNITNYINTTTSLSGSTDTPAQKADVIAALLADPNISPTLKAQIADAAIASGNATVVAAIALSLNQAGGQGVAIGILTTAIGQSTNPTFVQQVVANVGATIPTFSANVATAATGNTALAGIVGANQVVTVVNVTPVVVPVISPQQTIVGSLS